VSALAGRLLVPEDSLRCVLDKNSQLSRELIDLANENDDLREQIKRLRTQRDAAQTKLERTRAALRKAQQTRDHWARLCRGYETELGYGRKR
jgi:uncharacterized coiled-coil DUF342 family protein